jgi:hypothetical protein
MRVVADSHVLIFYLFTPDRLSEPALETLGEAEDGTGIVVSAATLGDLWYASHKSGPNSLAPGGRTGSLGGDFNGGAGEKIEPRI